MSDNQNTSISPKPTIEGNQKFWDRFYKDFHHLQKNINELEQLRNPAFKPEKIFIDAETRAKKVEELSKAVDDLLEVEKAKKDGPKIRPRHEFRDALKNGVIFKEFTAEEIHLVTDMYVSYGFYYEYLYTMLLLYQVLLEEYSKLDLLEEAKVDAIRQKAVGELALLLCSGTWRGKENFDNRTAFRNDMMKTIRKALTEPRTDGKETPLMSALCLSGGGIRSATFSLGLIQSLAKHGLLDKFTYLSTVSGGGYIGSWLTAWINRKGGETAEAVQRELVELAPGDVEPPEVTYLRSYSNYMSPKVGLLSADTWALIGVYLRNLLLNWTVFVPFIAAFLLIPRMLEQLVNHGGTLMGPAPSYAAGVFVTIGVILGIFGLFCVTVFRPSLHKFLRERPLQRKKPEGEGAKAALKRLFYRLAAPWRWLERRFLAAFDQKFVRDEIGIFQNNELWVVVLCVLPITLLAAIVTTYWKWTGAEGERMLPVKGLVNLVKTGNNRFYVLGFFAAVFAIVLIVHWNKRREGEFKSYWDRFFGSALIIICMVISALLIIPSETNFKLFGLVVFAEAVYVTSFLASRGVMYLFRKRGDVEKGTPENKDSLATNMAIEFGMSFLAASLGGLLFYAADDNLRLVNPISGDIQRAIQETVKVLPGEVAAYINFLPAGGPGNSDLYTILATPLFLLVFLISASVFVGIGSKIMNDMDREWLSRLGAWFLIVIAGWVAVFGLVLFGPEVVEFAGQAGKTGLASAGGIAGLITLVLGYYAKNAPQESAKPSPTRKKTSLIIRIAPQIAAPVFAAFLAVLLVMGTSAMIDFAGCRLSLLGYKAEAGCEPPYFAPDRAGLIVFGIWFVILATIGILMGWWININKFSLHATYRERLIRAYLGASRARPRLDTANSFTGLDEKDNIPMHQVFHRPFHLVNMTLNTAKSSKLNWQNRKSESFTATALHCGSSNMGDGSGTYRSSAVYGGGISLGTAAAISGAAASPNMGYYTQSAPVSALMALFNIRLGWWLGNPGRNGSETYIKSAPEWAPKLFFNEALGITGDTSPYVYLSDGGHFDNLGLYEVVLRRCKFVVVSDAAADVDFGFSDLGSAIHKIRVDMGIPIEFKPGDAPLQGRNCSWGTIKYSAVDKNEPDGTLIYIKPTLDGGEPVDIVNYKNKNPDFPHESTADQMYSETQFESYRSLGFHMIESICGKDHNPCTKCGSLEKLKENVDTYLKNFTSKKDGSYSLMKARERRARKEEKPPTQAG